MRDLIKKSKEQKWKDFLEDTTANSDPNKIWRVIKSLSGKSPSSMNNEVLIHENRMYQTNKAKADIFMKHYASISRLNIPKTQRRKKAIRRNLSSPTVEDSSTADFNNTELKLAIKSMKAKGAPGRDGIHPRFIKALGLTSQKFLLEIFNESWRTNTCPAKWREAIIIPILKKGKPPSKIDSYRPVSLTSCIAKTMERMVTSRLSYLTESNGWWSNDQAGFRARRLCEDQTLRLTQSISDGFQAKPPMRTVLALLDYSKAYDMVWKERLLELMSNKGVPNIMVRWIKGFLCDRKARVRMDGVLGATMKMHQGVPQGAVLSPILFLFYINGARDVIPENVSVSMYADDIALWYQHPDKVVAECKVQEAIEQVAEWSKEHKLKLNAAKCEIAFFSSNPHEAQWTPTASIDNTPFKFTKTPTFLGVTLDRTLTFRPQADNVKAKVLGRIKILSSLATKEWGWNRKCLTRIYNATINSVLHYCGPSWQPWLAKSNIAILERSHNKALRAITGQLMDTPLDCLRSECEVQSFETTMKRNCSIAWEKSARLNADNPRHALYTDPVVHRWKNRSSFSTMAIAESERLTLDSFIREPLLKLRGPPWDWDDDPRWEISTALTGHSNKKSCKEELLEDVVNTILSKGTPKYTIYTDGSAEKGTEHGGSAAIVTEGCAYAPTVIEELSRKGRRYTSSFETEMTAIWMALKWINKDELGTNKTKEKENKNKNKTKENLILICTDSQASQR